MVRRPNVLIYTFGACILLSLWLFLTPAHALLCMHACNVTVEMYRWIVSVKISFTATISSVSHHISTEPFPITCGECGNWLRHAVYSSHKYLNVEWLCNSISFNLSLYMEQIERPIAGWFFPKYSITLQAHGKNEHKTRRKKKLVVIETKQKRQQNKTSKLLNVTDVCSTIRFKLKPSAVFHT